MTKQKNLIPGSGRNSGLGHSGAAGEGRPVHEDPTEIDNLGLEEASREQPRHAADVKHHGTNPNATHHQ
jgi:hypothetical protein